MLSILHAFHVIAALCLAILVLFLESPSEGCHGDSLASPLDEQMLSSPIIDSVAAKQHNDRALTDNLDYIQTHEGQVGVVEAQIYQESNLVFLFITIAERDNSHSEPRRAAVSAPRWLRIYSQHCISVSANGRVTNVTLKGYQPLDSRASTVFKCDDSFYLWRGLQVRTRIPLLYQLIDNQWVLIGEDMYPKAARVLLSGDIKDTEEYLLNTSEAMGCRRIAHSDTTGFVVDQIESRDAELLIDIQNDGLIARSLRKNGWQKLILLFVSSDPPGSRVYNIIEQSK